MDVVGLVGSEDCS